jgi:hypothetical protein
MIRITRHLPTLMLLVAGACADLAGPSGDPEMSVGSEPGAGSVAMTSAALAPPPGTQPGEPYRWRVRSWRSPLGLQVVRYGIAIDGIPVYGQAQIEIYDDAGRLVQRAGSGDAVLAELRARGPAAFRQWPHPRGPLADITGGDPLVHRSERPVWHDTGGVLSPAVVEEQVNLRGRTPVGEAAVTDAATGAVLARHSVLFELGGPDYLVYARPDGRPWTSPLGNTSPHPTGVPDGKVPAPVPQAVHDQRAARHALSDPWLPPGATLTRGNNAVAFFDSLIDANGIFVDAFDDQGNDTPEYGPEPDEAGHDFFAHSTAGRFAFPYDPANTVHEYFQDGIVGDPMPFPDPSDVALNAKIVETFYAANWLHDVFYRAGFDEVAGNAQQSNYGRGGIEGDPLLVHAGFNGTVTFPAPEGESPVLDLGLNPRSASRRDQGMDFSTMAHEWGHTMIGRLAGGPDGTGMDNLQGMAMHEGIADFISVLVNYNDGDDPHAAFPVGSYGNLDYIEFRTTLPPVEAPADAMYFGIRRYPYSLDPVKNPLTFRNLAEPPPADRPYYNWKDRGQILGEPHTAGEVFSEALFSCFGRIVLAHPDARPEHNRDRMAAYLVAGLAAFRFQPSMLDARDAILSVIRFASPFEDYPACRAGFAAHGMGAGALGPDRQFGDDPDQPPPDAYDPADIVESYVEADRALHVAGATFVAATARAPGSIRVDVRNTGLVDLERTRLVVRPAVPGAARFPDGHRAQLAALAPEEVASGVLRVAVDPCRLPPDPAQPGMRAFDYTVEASSPGRQPVHVVAAFHTAVAAAACPDHPRSLASSSLP